MKEIARIELPNKVVCGKRKTMTNKVVYMSGNAVNGLNHWSKSEAKKDYKAVLYDTIHALKKMKKIKIVLEVRAHNDNFDLDNLCTHFKFLQDAIVECGKLVDDNVKFIPSIGVEWLGLTKEKGKKVEAVIYEL